MGQHNLPNCCEAELHRCVHPPDQRPKLLQSHVEFSGLCWLLQDFSTAPPASSALKVQGEFGRRTVSLKHLV